MGELLQARCVQGGVQRDRPVHLGQADALDTRQARGQNRAIDERNPPSLLRHGVEIRPQRGRVHRRVQRRSDPLPPSRQQHPDPVDPETGSRHRQLTSGQDTWSARCGVIRTPGAAGGPGKPTGSNPDRAPRSDPTADDVAYWLAMHSPAWRDRIRYVAIDMCTVFVAAIRRYLPNATIVVDHFHVVKLANDTVSEVRRRIATQLRGRRGRKTDPEYTVRNLLRRNHEDLSDTAFAKLWNTLVDLEGPGLTILTTWIAKEELRRLLDLAGTGADRSVISHRLYRFYTWCADAAVPELERLARTIQTWWPAIEAFLHTKITNAASEGYNRVVKLDARNGYGYRNPENQRLRTRCATTRRARGCLNPD